MAYNFADRHIGPRKSQYDQMLKTIGVSSIDELIRQTFPNDILHKELLPLDPAMSEHEYLARLKAIASKNKNMRSMIGLGFYGTAVPSVIMRNIFENPSWYTSYTPYQAEISQGRLEALINFQTMISSLTGFELSNCSLLDDATAAAEAMRMAYDLRSRADVKAGKNKFFVDKNVFPQVLSVIETRAFGFNIEVIVGDYKEVMEKGFDPMCFGALVQFPAADGSVRDYSEFCAKAHESNILVAADCDLLALALYKEPAAWGADMAIGTAQRFGLPMGFGGPTAGWMATKMDYKRNIPGRIIGISVDRLGNKALRLALQTREQHIKREKATSNICTATALMAVMTGMYAAYHGKDGIRDIAQSAYKYAHVAAEKLREAGFKVSNEHFFDTIRVEGINAAEIREKALAAGFNFYYPCEKCVQISFDELSNCEETKAVLKVFGVEVTACCKTPLDRVDTLKRETEYLTQKVFNTYHSETEMMRYIKKLERKDISLTHSMIPLGSCTMKLNAATEMMPMTWSELGNVHPFAPADQTEGSMQIIDEMERDLAIVTGFEAVSIQPNSGAAGEYAALMTIKNYYAATNQLHRNKMIIPTSAHGTNPASCVMAGCIPVLVNCDDKGNVIVDELRQKAQENKDELFGIMITYPSTHGIFEVEIKEICNIIHECGGQVFMDGANMNGQAGITSPGFIGADCCHLNLHKSFAMAHGGGGPGVGAIGVAKHLVPYLPGHPVRYPEYITVSGERVCPEKLERKINAVSAAPYGAALLNSVTHAYLKMLGADGLKMVTATAILNANYMAERLKPEFEILYTGANGRVGHECIVNLQSFKAEYGVDATDIAKRLMDYGFHAPTLSFPVHETLMIEPTESESLEEIERFVEAMKSIKAECEDIKAGRADKEDNVIKMAPHTAEEVCGNEWKHPYTREQAAYPLAWIRENKFWPGSARVDNGYGDRNLVPVVE